VRNQGEGFTVAILSIKRNCRAPPNRVDALVMLFWEMDFESLIAPPEDQSDRHAPTRQPRDRDECAAGPWDK